MRRLTRPRVVPPTIVKINALGDDWKKKVSKPPSNGKWNQADVRGVLYAMHGRACAYCQKDISSLRGDVDHFRPKSIYPWLKYDFNNLFLSCRTCNCAYKLSKFPLSGGAKHLDSFEHAANLHKEPRLLLNPADDDVEKWISFDVRGIPCWAISVVSDSKVAAARVDATIAFFGLNANPRLVRERDEALGDALAKIAEIRDAKERHQPVSEQSILALRRLASRFEPYGIVVRVALREFASDLLPLPSLAEELLWLIDDVAAYLRVIDEIRARNPEEDRDWLDREEIESCYGLAALALSDVLDRGRLANHLSGLGLAARIQPFMDELEIA